MATTLPLLSQRTRACATTLAWMTPSWAAVATLVQPTTLVLPMCMSRLQSSTSTHKHHRLLPLLLHRALPRMRSLLLACLQSQLPRSRGLSRHLVPHPRLRNIRLQKERPQNPRVMKLRLPSPLKHRPASRNCHHTKPHFGQSLLLLAAPMEHLRLPLKSLHPTPCPVTSHLWARLAGSRLWQQ